MAKVLLADDEEALRLMFGRQLRRAGHTVTVAEDGQAAADLLMQEDFDVVVSDMKMPRLDGMGLLARASEIAPTTEFIILTGHGNMENAVQAFKTGNLFDYLLKPLNDIHELDGVVDRAVERRFLRAENGRLVKELKARVDELEESRQKLTFLAERDGLTGLLNHRTVHVRLEATLYAQPASKSIEAIGNEIRNEANTNWAEADREEQKEEQKAQATAPVAVIQMDMDGFKRLNDTYGHPTGDEILRHVACALQASCPPAGFIGRCGGDEFIIVCPGMDAQQAENVAEDVRAYLHRHPFINPEGTPLPLQLCFGISDTESVSRSPIELVAAADAALYASKRQGGNAVTLHLDRAAPQNGQNLEGTAYTILEGLVTTIGHKDQYTKLHSEHMTGFALALTEALGCSEEMYGVVRIAGLLHDVGKIGVPDSILRKPGKLTAEEYEIMKTHVSLSAAIIHGLPNLPDILDAVANHHERWDGKGYPRGVSGEQIPYLGRIMAIADAFSAMTLDRPYRAGMSTEMALAEIGRGAGAQFDPRLARVFVDTMCAGQNGQAKMDKAA
jgi:diguanylate cyclase (GGDEF)-like protein